MRMIYRYTLDKDTMHKMGMYYTPVWLAELTIERALMYLAGRNSPLENIDVFFMGHGRIPSVLEPSAGSGVFVVAYINYLAEWNKKYGKLSDRELARQIIDNVYANDIDTVAVSLLYLNMDMALREIYWKYRELGTPKIYNKDFLFDFRVDKKFDLIIGNPPWIGWDYIDRDYRERVRELYRYYGIDKTLGHGCGRVKRDLASLFFVRSADKFLKQGGIIAFLVPFTLFKNMAGAGFRAMFGKSDMSKKGLGFKLRALEVHDLSGLDPFDAQNLPSLVVARKVSASDVSKVYSVKHFIWRKTGGGLWDDARLDDVRDKLRSTELVMVPISKDDVAYPWAQLFGGMGGVLRKVFVEWGAGKQYYVAREGLNTGLNPVYYVRVLDERDGLVLVENVHKRAKVRVRSVRAWVEKDLVYPLVRGEDVGRWAFKWDVKSRNEREYVILPVDPSTGKVYDERTMIERYPYAYRYFKQFEDVLRQRNGYPYKVLMRNKDIPAYYVFNADHVLSPYKVAWRKVGSGYSSGVGFGCVAVVGEYIPDQTVIMVSVADDSEAYYLSGVLNSIIVRMAVASCTYGTVQVTNILDFVYVPRFDQRDPLHREIAELSKKIHGAVRRGVDIRGLEEDLDRKVAELYGITEAELEQIRKLYRTLGGK